MAKLEQYHSQLSSKYERNTIRWRLNLNQLPDISSFLNSLLRTQLITNTEVVQQNNNSHQKNFSLRRLRSPSLPPIDKTITRWVTICLRTAANNPSTRESLERRKLICDCVISFYSNGNCSTKITKEMCRGWSQVVGSWWIKLNKNDPTDGVDLILTFAQLPPN